MSHTLFVKIVARDTVYEYLHNYYNSKTSENHKGDSGIDLIYPEDVNCKINDVTFISLGIQCKLVLNKTVTDTTHCITFPSSSYDLVPRSSISKTPLSMANSIGIIDAGYRGDVITAVRCHPDERFSMSEDYKITKGTKLFQIVAPDRMPIKVVIVNELDETERGSGGFGSTSEHVTLKAQRL